MLGHRILAEMKRRSFKFGVFPVSALLLSSLVWVWCASIAVPAALAQDAAQRMVKGKVVDKQDAGIKGAVVYLKDDHSLAVKSFFSGDDGSYRFAQLAQNVDYELWAESNGKKSAVKTISSFNSKAELEITLKIDLAK
jgi:Carboxypeptidase regulatory-like domain